VKLFLSNPLKEYGATIGYFPVDNTTLDYLRLSGRDEKRIEWIEKYLR
jgi:aconitate hydratase